MADFISQVWRDANIRSIVIAIIILVLSEFVRRLLTPKALVVWGISHQHFFLNPNGKTNIQVRVTQIFVQNIGRAVAEDVEITFNYKPEIFDIWPLGMVSYEMRDRFLLLNIKNQNRKEFFTIDILNQLGEIHAVVGARWSGGVSKQIIMSTMQVFPRWAQRLAQTFFFIGIAAFIFSVVRVILILPR